MKMTKQKVEVCEQTDFSLIGIKKHIERCARVCYNSEHKITEDSYEKFFDMLVKNEHYGALAHGTVYLKMDKEDPDLDYFRGSPWSVDFETPYSFETYVSTNMRVIAENDLWHLLYDNLISDIKDIPNYMLSRRVTVKVITSIAMSRELNRHCTLAITERSTRYVKVDEDSYCAIIPEYDEEFTHEQRKLYIDSIHSGISSYNELIEQGVPKQIARDVLPLATMTEVYYTAYIYDWYNVIEKRSGSGVHPQMKDLVTKIKEVI